MLDFCFCRFWDCMAYKLIFSLVMEIIHVNFIQNENHGLKELCSSAMNQPWQDSSCNQTAYRKIYFDSRLYNYYARMVINHLYFNSHSRTLIFYKRQFSVSNFILSNSHKAQNVIIHRIKTHSGWTLSLNPKGCTLLFCSTPLYTFSLLNGISHAFVPPSTCHQFTVLSLSI